MNQLDFKVRISQSTRDLYGAALRQSLRDFEDTLVCVGLRLIVSDCCFFVPCTNILTYLLTYDTSSSADSSQVKGQGHSETLNGQCTLGGIF